MIDKQSLLSVLDRWNTWKQQPDAGVIRRKYVEQIAPFLERKEVIVLKGIRRCGKSTLMKQLMMSLLKKGVSKEQLLYLNLEDYNLSPFLTMDLLEFVFQTYRNHVNRNKKTFFFIDEIQLINGWERWIRTKYDLQEDVKFIISGSSASLISKEFSTKLTGRNISFQIKPASFGEFLEFNKNGLLDEYLEYGGFPEVILEKNVHAKLKLLQQYFEDIVHKDVIDRYKIRNPKQVHLLARYLCSNAGQKISYHKLAKSFGLSTGTAITYVKYLVDTFLFYEVSYFSYSVKIKYDVTKLSKIYVADNGLINIAEIKFSQSTGKKYENSVCIKIFEHHDSASYWSGKNEVDFVVSDTAINVVSSNNIPEREYKGPAEIKTKFKQITNALIVTKSKKKIEQDVGLVPLNEFLLASKIGK